jgi:glycosyltransferase involved in cell wall biosynthesis
VDGITIFFPAYNEEMYVRRAVEAAREVVELMVQRGEISDYEILIINDASTDNTASVAEELAAGDESVRVIHHEVNRGLGGAMKSGFAHATKEVILYSDIDLPFDMMELTKAYRFMRYYEADIVSAFRFDRTGEGLRRLIYSKCYNALIMTLFRLRVKDVNFAFKLIRKSVFDHIVLKADGSFIDAELLIKADRLGMRIIQFGTNYFHRSRGISTLSSWKVIFKILGELSSFYRELKSIKPIK